MSSFILVQKQAKQSQTYSPTKEFFLARHAVSPGPSAMRLEDHVDHDGFTHGLHVFIYFGSKVGPCLTFSFARHAVSHDPSARTAMRFAIHLNAIRRHVDHDGFTH